MKTLTNYLSMIVLAVLGTACVSGGFDENPQLDELENALKKAPKVESISVNGVVVEKNTQSQRQVDARIGDVLKLDAVFSSGKDAQLTELEFFRQYYGVIYPQEAPHPVDSLTDGFYDLSGLESSFSYEYTVPEEDDEGFHFEAGNIITIQIRVKNSLDNYGYRSLVIHLVDEEE